MERNIVCRGDYFQRTGIPLSITESYFNERCSKDLIINFFNIQDVKLYLSIVAFGVYYIYRILSRKLHNLFSPRQKRNEKES